MTTFTTSLYNHSTKKFINQEVHLASLQVMLLGATGTFTATHTTLDQVAGAAGPHRAKEVYGNGWAEGGQAIAAAAAATVTTNDTALSGSDVRVRAAGGDITAYNAVIFDNADANKAPLIHIAFSAALTALEGVDFLVPMTAILNGIYV